jgi:hypothetical protein
MKNIKTLTKGNIIVEDIKIGDTHYEFSGPFGIECIVETKPKQDEEGNWSWESRNVNTDVVINYFVHKDYPHYGPNLYDNKAYKVNTWI